MSNKRVLLFAKVTLIAIGLILTNHQISASIQYFVEDELYFPLTFTLFIWAVSIPAIGFIAFVPAKMMRIAWALILGISTFLGDLHFRIVGAPLTFEAIEAMSDTTLVDFEMLGFYADFIIDSLVSTAFLVAGIIIAPPTFRKLNLRSLYVLPLLPFCFLMGIIYYFSGATIHETKGVPSQFYPASLLTIYSIIATPMPDKSAIIIPHVRDNLVRHIVLIVDESISGDFMDLNLHRGTTPWLASRASSIANFGIATSGTNCSNSSNAILRLGANPETLGKKGQSILGNPSIWKYASQAGYETNYLDAQNSSIGFQNYTNKEEFALIDHYVQNTPGLEKAYQDLELADRLRKILTRNTAQFVFVNKRGAHFPYEGNYPREKAFFLPAMESYEAIRERERLVNSYKNVIMWTVDTFFERLVNNADLSNSVLIYTSDHGQNLLDDGKPVTHCRRVAQTLNEVIVPLLVFTDHPELFDIFKQSASTHFNRASHFEVFPTILTLFGYDREKIKDLYYQDLFESPSTPLGFATGDITGRYGRQPTWNSTDGLEDYVR